MSRELNHVPANYPVLLADVKQRIRLARARAIMAVNAELNALYWEVGSLIGNGVRGGAPVLSLGWLATYVMSFLRRRGSLCATSVGCLPSTASTPTSKFCHRLWQNWRIPRCRSRLRRSL